MTYGGEADVSHMAELTPANAGKFTQGNFPSAYEPEQKRGTTISKIVIL